MQSLSFHKCIYLLCCSDDDVQHIVTAAFVEAGVEQADGLKFADFEAAFHDIDIAMEVEMPTAY